MLLEYYLGSIFKYYDVWNFIGGGRSPMGELVISGLEWDGLCELLSTTLRWDDLLIVFPINLVSKRVHQLFL